MKGTNDGMYRNANGNVVFRYKLSGSKAEMDAYKEIQGDNYRESDDGKPLFFTTRESRKVITLGITQDGERVYVDNSIQHRLNAAVENVKGSAFEDEVKKVAAAAYLEDILGSSNIAAGTSASDPAQIEDDASVEGKEGDPSDM